MAVVDTDKVLSAISKAVVVSLIGLGVNYLSKIGELNTNIVQLKTEIQGVTVNQDLINRNLKEQLDKLDRRMEKIEDRKNIGEKR